MKPLDFALLGTGRISAWQLAPALALAGGARLWSVLSRDRTRAEAFARTHGAAAPQPAHDDLSTLLADPELDAVLVATPDGLHAAQSLAAIEAGKHVLVEKPMATSSADATRMVEAAARAGVRLGVAHHLRWHAGHREVVERLRAGLLGAPRHMRAQWSWPAPDDSNWRAHPDVGRWWSLAGVGTHCLDLIRWAMVPACGEVTRIVGVTSHAVWSGPHDETAVAVMSFESGATAELCSSVQFGAPSRMEVYGARGWAVGTGTLGPAGDGAIETDAGPLAYEVAHPYVGEIEDFAHAVREGRAPEVDGAEGLRNVELLEALVRSAGEG